jgi:hypothetical protein
MKTEVYSWRLSNELKSDLEREARLRKISVSSVLDSAVRDWLKKSGTESGEDKEQQRLHTAAKACFGTFRGREPRRAENARKLIQQRLRERYGR